MGERRCGYCREFGHFTTACDKRLTHIDAIKQHTVAQRRAMIEGLIHCGYGVGAIVEAYHFYSGEMVNCIITQDSLDRITGQNPTFESRNKRYSKQVTTYLHSYDGTPMREEWAKDEDLRLHDHDSMTIPVTPLAIGIEELHLNVHMSQVPSYFGKNPTSMRRTPSWMRFGALISPSNDGEVKMEIVKKKIYMNGRLTLKRGASWVDL